MEWGEGRWERGRGRGDWAGENGEGARHKGKGGWDACEGSKVGGGEEGERGRRK